MLRAMTEAPAGTRDREARAGRAGRVATPHPGAMGPEGEEGAAVKVAPRPSPAARVGMEERAMATVAEATQGMEAKEEDPDTGMAAEAEEGVMAARRVQVEPADAAEMEAAQAVEEMEETAAAISPAEMVAAEETADPAGG